MSDQETQVIQHQRDEVGQVSIWKSQGGKTLWSVKVPANGKDDTDERMEEAYQTALRLAKELKKETQNL